MFSGTNSGCRFSASVTPRTSPTIVTRLPAYVADDWYRELFPTRLSKHWQAMSEFATTAQGCQLATSVGDVLTGLGADIIIIDDPLKPEEALSQAQRQAANDWFDHTLYSRLTTRGRVRSS